jgi:hypothetical protein
VAQNVPAETAAAQAANVARSPAEAAEGAHDHDAGDAGATGFVGADENPAAHSTTKQDTELRREIRGLEKQRDDVTKQLQALESDLNQLKRGGAAETRLKELYDARAQTLSQYSALEARLAERRNRVAGYARSKQTKQPKATAANPPAESDVLDPTTVRGYSRGSARPAPREHNPYAGTFPNAPAPAGASNYGGQLAAPPAGTRPPAQDFGQPRPGAAVPGGEAVEPARVGGGAGAGVQLDLVNLANSVADASGAVRVAKAQLQAAVARADGPGNRMEVATAEATLESATRRQELLRGIARLALDGAARDLDRHRKLAQNNLVSVEELGQREAKVEMLKLIVASAEDGGGRAGGGARR